MEGKEMHLHIGAGAIGLGLVLPLFSEQRRMVIVAPAAGELADELRRRDDKALTVQIRVEGSGPAHDLPIKRRTLRAVFADDAAAHKALSADASESVLLFCDDIARCGEFVRNATSVSIAVRKKEPQLLVADGLSRIDWGRVVPPLFVFENECEIKACKLPISELVIDRICLPPYIDDSGDLIVRVEKDASVVAKVPFLWKTDIWRCADRHGEFDFFRRRKRLLVNSVHAALVFVSFAYLVERRLGLEEWRHQFLPVLVDAMKGTGQWQLLQTFVKVQAMRVVIETPAAQRAELFPQATEEELYRSLLRYSDEVLSRMAALPDSVARIFNVDESKELMRVLSAASDKFDVHITEYFRFVLGHQNEMNKFEALGPPESHEAVDAGVLLTDVGTSIVGNAWRGHVAAQARARGAARALKPDHAEAQTSGSSGAIK